MKNRILGILGVLFCALMTFGQSLEVEAIKGAIYTGTHYDTCYTTNKSVSSTVLNSNPRFQKYLELKEISEDKARAFQNSLATSEIIINFTAAWDDNLDAKNAFRFAADMWELEVVSSVPIIIEADFAALGGNTIAQNSSPSVSNVPNAPDPTVSYNTSLANAIAGIDLIPGRSDLFQTYSSDFNFYFGLDANPPSNQTDFVTIAFHEIGHGMGISGTGSENGFSSTPRSWDIFIESGDGTSTVNLGTGSPEQIAAMISDDLFINSFNTNAALDGERAKIYAPDPFNGGSSMSHWDENTFVFGDPNSLMTPFNNRGEAIHDIGDITRGILRDMGWELAPRSEFDLGVATIVSPSSAQNLSSSESVTVILGNLGIESVSNIEVSYSINGGELVTEIFEGTLEPNEEKEFTFSQGADLSEGGQTYRIEASVNYFIDEFEDNNSTFKDVSNLLPVSSFPYSESFELGTSGWTVDGNDGVWELGTPAGDIIIGASDGNNAWVTQISNNYPDQSTASVVSPVFDLSTYQDPVFSFDIFYDIETGWDGAALQVSMDNGATWSTVGQLGDDNNWYTDGDERSATDGEGADGIDALTASIGDGDGWTGADDSGTNGYVRASHVIEDAGGESSVILRVVFSSDQATNNEGFSFDNVEIVANALEANDVGIVSIDSPLSGSLTNNETISVTIENFGTSAQSNFELTYQVDDNTPITETFSETIQPGETASFSFSQTADLSTLKAYTITSTTNLTSDAIAENNSFATSVVNFATITSFPYNESFETENHFWVAGGVNSSWERTNPSGLIINAASEGTFAFVTNGAGDYSANENSQLLSPGFDLSQMTNPAISFDIWYESEKAVDGVTLESSIDNGETWIPVGSLNDLINWYNESGLEFSSQSSEEGWSGSSSQYLKTFNAMSSLAGEDFVQLRFLFKADNEIQSEGISIDNISIFDEANVDFTITCPEDVVASNDAGEAFATVTLDNPTVTGGSSPTFYNDYTNSTTAENGEFFIGTETINFLVQSGGRFALCSSNVQVNDTEGPVIDCPNEIIVAIPDGETSATVEYSLPSFTENFGFPIEVTYQVDRTIDGTSGVACGAGANAYLRVFDLVNDFNISSDYIVQSVDVGFQANATSGTFEADANIYTFDGQNLDVNSREDFVYANLKLVGTSTFTVDLSAGDQLVNVPVTAVIPQGQIAVLEVFTEATSEVVFPGANPNVTGGRSFLASSACGVPEPEDVRFVGDGFPNSQFVMFMNGSGNSDEIELELVSGLGSGAEFSVGDNTESYRITDSFGNESTCSFNVKVVVAELDAPVATASSNALANSFEANWSTVSNATAYEVFVSDNNFVSTLSEYNGLEVATNSVVIDGLDVNSTYQYKVIAKNGSGGISQFSNTIITTTLIESPLLNSPLDLTASGFRIGWSPVQKIKEYEIDVSDDDFNTFASGFNATISAENQIIVTGLNPLTNYSVRVRAINDGGKSANSNVIMVTTLAAAPRATSATDVGSSSFTASWEIVDNIVEYSVEVSDDGFNSLVAGFDGITTAQNSIAVTGLEPNTTYIYRVKSLSVNGDSEFSNLIRVTTLAEVPAALAPENVNSYGFIAHWEEAKNVLTYELDVSQDNFATFLSGFESKRVNGNSLLINDLTLGATYQYRVRSVNRSGIITENSNIIEVTLTNEATLGAPIAVDASDIEQTSFVANWNASNGALFYQIEVSEDNFSSLLPEYNGVKVYNTSFKINGLEAETEYKYRVRAFDNEGFSENSNEVTAITAEPLSIVHSDFGLIKLYPNPVFAGKLSLSLSRNLDEALNLAIMDLNGKILVDQDFQYSINNEIIELDLSALSNGTYILKMATKSSSKSFKILVDAK